MKMEMKLDIILNKPKTVKDIEKENCQGLFAHDFLHEKVMNINGVRLIKWKICDIQSVWDTLQNQNHQVKVKKIFVPNRFCLELY